MSRKEKSADVKAYEQHVKTPIQAFCPKCNVWYPVKSNAHAGH